MKAVVIGFVLLGGGVAGLLAFREPVAGYSVDLVGSGPDAGRQVEARCLDGRATGEFAGDQRAESECRAAEDSVKLGRVGKLVASGVVAALGLGVLVSGLRGWGHDVRSRLSYRRMVTHHARDRSRGRGRR